ncbi:MAG: hypothetical protein GY863_24070 [bacterium]|nr:hypothetical protein [bacterium]
MKANVILLILIISILTFSCSNTPDQDQELADISGPYLGQDPPGMTPEIFAPGIISKRYNEFKIVFTPDGKELFLQIWGAPYPVICTSKEIDGRWTKLEAANFSGQTIECFDISPDGKKLFGSSRRLLEGGGGLSNDWFVWMAEKSEIGWSDIRDLGPSIHGYPTVAANGNLYLAEDSDMWVSEYVNGEYTEMVKLGNSVSTDRYSEQDPFIAPDESYLMFCRREGGYGSWDIYISFRRDDGSWTEAVNMGDKINSNVSDVYPFVTTDGKYFFFSSRRTIHEEYSNIPITYEEKMKIMNSPGNGLQDIYWVDARIIDTFKPDEIK